MVTIVSLPRVCVVSMCPRSCSSLVSCRIQTLALTLFLDLYILVLCVNSVLLKQNSNYMTNSDRNLLISEIFDILVKSIQKSPNLQVFHLQYDFFADFETLMIVFTSCKKLNEIKFSGPFFLQPSHLVRSILAKFWFKMLLWIIILKTFRKWSKNKTIAIDL